MSQQPTKLAEFIDAVREGLVCDRCGAYVGGIGRTQFRPAPYPVALGKIGVDAEAEALVGFEWHMVGLLRQGKFALRHPQREGRCVGVREWLAEDDDVDEAGDAASV